MMSPKIAVVELNKNQKLEIGELMQKLGRKLGAGMPAIKGLGLALGLLWPLLSLAASTTTSTVTYEYDPVTGSLLSQSLNPDTPQANVKTAYTYDGYGNRRTTTVSSAATGQAAIPSRTVETVTYDPYGIAPTSYTNALGQQSSASYDPYHLPLYVDSLNGLRSIWVYDSFGRQTQETRPDGTISKWSYSLCSPDTPCALPTAKYFVLKRSYAANGSTENAPMVKSYYDMLSRIVRNETIGFDGTSVITQDTEYDSFGRVYRSSRPYYAGQSIQWTVFSYDVLGRQTDVLGPDGAHAHTDYSGLTVVETNPLGQTRTTVKDSRGLLTRVTDTDNNSLSYQYDANGNLTQTTDPQGNLTTYVYDALNHRLSSSDPDLGKWNYVYDVLGELIQQTDPKGQVTTMAYDLRGRVTNRSEPDLKSNWTYDNCTMGKGKLCKVTADNGYSSTQTYDDKGRPATTSTTIGTAYQTSVTYDADGHVLTQAYPTGLNLQYVYTALGYLKEVRNNSSNALYWQANARDAEGHLTQQTYGNNVVTQQVFDPATGRLNTITAGANNAVQNLSFTYDLRGNMLTRGDANQSLSETFLYDALNRLTSNTVNSAGAGLVTQTYAYDNIGNITSRSDMGAYTYGPVNARPHAVDHIVMADGSIRQYSYDGVGNLTQEVQRDASNNVIAAKGRTETWTSFNMPLSLTSPVSMGAFVYGPDHQRIKMTVDGTTTTYLNPDNAGGLLYEKDVKSDGTIEHRHFVTVGGGVVALIKQTGTGTQSVLYMHRDNLGSTTTITNASGAVIERMAYEPFGKRRTPQGAMDPNNIIAGVNTDRGYTNHEHLDGLDLIHMNGRVYDPTTGRFISADPNVPYPTNIQSYNRYSYVRNNPLVTLDPSGFWDDGGASFSGWIDRTSGELGNYFNSSLNFSFAWGTGGGSNQQSGTTGTTRSTCNVAIPQPCPGGPSIDNSFGVDGPGSVSVPGASLWDVTKDIMIGAQVTFQAPKLTVTRDVPANAVLYKMPNGDAFYAPPNTDWKDIYIAGRIGGLNPFAVHDAVWQFGKFDFQRDATKGMFYRAYTDASNYGVGIYMYGAGYSLSETIMIGSIASFLGSSNSLDPAQRDYWVKGWKAADAMYSKDLPVRRRDPLNPPIRQGH
ncbi:hypothetical protein GTP91_24805 [Rugamonas sp. FT82W]|uniref:RHS repeat-associated core domain-containing protein n=1 Tax=Duganella vulcania TaxID=2692166 RepID=A0A845GC60_9BURK|nr:RHS repeat protein [Duganella vulcania]MYM90379.1 hypothetical protein [Duganella vulcania]